MSVSFYNVFYKWDLIQVDKDDNKYVDCYLASGANYLVTNDRHFDVLKSIDFPPVNVVDIDAFMEMLSKEKQV